MPPAADSLFVTHPQYAMAAVLVLLGLFLIVSAVWSDATGEMSLQNEGGFGGRRVVSRDEEPGKFRAMLNSCVIGAIALFGSALFIVLFL